MGIQPTRRVRARSNGSRARRALAVAAACAFAAGREAAAQTTTWSGGGGSWFDAGGWTAGVPDGNVDAVVGGTGAPGGTLTAAGQGAVVRSLNLGAGYTLRADTSLHLYGDARIDGAAETSLLLSHTPAGGQAVDGSGTLTLHPSGWTTMGNGTVTIGAGLTVSGPGGLWFDRPFGSTSGFVNRGTVVSGGRLTINAPFRNEGTIRTAANQSMVVNSRVAWQNAGTIELGGRLELGATITAGDVGRIVRGAKSEVVFGGTMQNTGGTFQLDATTGDWTTRNATFVGGTIRTADGARLRIDGDTRLTDVTLDTGASGVGMVTTFGTLSVTNSLTLRDSVLDLSAAPLSMASGSVAFGGTASAVLGTGEIRMGTSFAASVGREFASSPGVTTIGEGILIHGTNGTITSGNGSLLLQGTVAADVAGGSLWVTGGVTNTGSIKALNGGNLALYAVWHNAGVLEVDGRSTLTLGGFFLPQDVGTIKRAPGGVVRLTDFFELAGGEFALDATTGDWEARNARISNGTFGATGGARLIVDSVTLDAVRLRTSPVLRGTGTAGATVNVVHDLTLDGADVLLAGAGGTPGVLAFSGTNGAQALGGSGSVTFGANASSALTNGSGRALTIGSGVLVHGQNGQIQGGAGGIANYGRIRADVTGGVLHLVGVTNHGAIELAGGGVRADGDLTQSAGGVVRVALAALSSSASTSSAPLIVSGTLTLGGALEVSAEGFSPTPLGSYAVVSYGGRVGRFSSYAGLDLPGPMTLAPIYSPTDLRLVATLPGDADLNGNVNFDDLLRLAKSYNASGEAAAWGSGDFTGDGRVNFDDLLVLAKAYNQQLPASVPGAGVGFESALAAAQLASVPEPGVGVVGGIGVMFLGRRRRGEGNAAGKPAG